MPAALSTRPAKSRFIVGIALALLLSVAVWAFSSAFVSSAKSDCIALYQKAKTAADTAAVDRTIPAQRRKTAEAMSCGHLRELSSGK